jgi:predicted nucleotidyltransferase
MQDFILAKREEIAELCRKHHVRRLSVFGSAVRDDFDPATSDVDLRVEFEALAAAPYAQNYFSLRRALTHELHREVDLVSAPVIRNPFFRSEIESTQELLYAA